jgi:hypothetical protein
MFCPRTSNNVYLTSIYAGRPQEAQEANLAHLSHFQENESSLKAYDESLINTAKSGMSDSNFMIGARQTLALTGSFIKNFVVSTALFAIYKEFDPSILGVEFDNSPTVICGRLASYIGKPEVVTECLNSAFPEFNRLPLAIVNVGKYLNHEGEIPFTTLKLKDIHPILEGTTNLQLLVAGSLLYAAYQGYSLYKERVQRQENARQNVISSLTKHYRLMGEPLENRPEQIQDLRSKRHLFENSLAELNLSRTVCSEIVDRLFDPISDAELAKVTAEFKAAQKK